MLTRPRFLNLLVAGLIGSALSLSSSIAIANNVRVALEGELLVVRGDNASNNIVIRGNQGGDVFVVGRNGTTVNGQPSVSYRRIALNEIQVLLGGGNDILTLNQLRVNNDLFVNLGGGNDRVVSGNVPSTVGNNLVIEGGSGNDIVRLTGWTVVSDLYIDGQGGPLNATLSDMVIAFGLTIIGDDARDVINLTGCASGDFTSLETKGGDDVVNVSDHEAFGVSVQTDWGADRVNLLGLSILEDLEITAGLQNDRVEMTDVMAGKNIKVAVDSGADVVDGQDVYAAFDLEFIGGDGADTFVNGGVAGGTKTEIKEFEIFR